MARQPSDSHVIGRNLRSWLRPRRSADYYSNIETRLLFQMETISKFLRAIDQ